MAQLRAPLRLHQLVALGVSVLSGCTLGPSYHGPPDVAPRALKAPAFRRAPPGAVSSAPALARWWQTLHDGQLTQLIETGLASSPDVQAAEARVLEARAGLRGQERSALPSGSAAASYLHISLPSTPLGLSDLGLYNLGFDATWEADLFGGTRRAIESASAQAQAAAADLADTHVQLSAEIAQAYINLRDVQQRITLVRQSADLEQQVLSLTQERRAQGVASDIDVERIRTQVESTQSQVIPLDGQITEAEDELAVLTGQAPGALDADLATPKPLPALPATLPVGNPAALIRQRPDIRAAEWRLVSQNAQIGQREADWFPKLTLLGDLGLSSAVPGELVQRQSFMWAGVPILQWNVLDFGRTKARVDQARAGLQEARALYESTVLGALRDANVALSRYGHQRQNVVNLRAVEASATRTAQLTQQRYRAGASSALDWLDAERTRFAAEQNRIAAEAELLRDFVALQKSLGLGWQPR